MWYPIDGSVENLLKQCAEKWKCSKEEAVQSMVFVYGKKKITNYQDYLFHGETSEYYMNTRTGTVKLYVFIDERTNFYSLLSKTEKRNYTKINHAIMTFYNTLRNAC